MFLIFLPKINILIYHFISIKEREFFSQVPKRENNKKAKKKPILDFWNLAHVYLHRFCDTSEGPRGWRNRFHFLRKIPNTINFDLLTILNQPHRRSPRKKTKKKSLKFLRYQTKYLNYDCVEEILIGFCVTNSRSFQYSLSSMESFILSHLMTKILISFGYIKKKTFRMFFSSAKSQSNKTVVSVEKTKVEVYHIPNNFLVNIPHEFPSNDIIFQTCRIFFLTTFFQF